MILRRGCAVLLPAVAAALCWCGAVAAAAAAADDGSLELAPRDLLHRALSGRFGSFSPFSPERSHARLEADDGGGECSPDGGGSCAAVQGVEGFFVCLSMTSDDGTAGDAGSCSMWIREERGGVEGGTNHCCQSCSVCEEHGGMSFDCGNVVEKFEDTCATSLSVPEDFVLVGSEKVAAAEAEAEAESAKAEAEAESAKAEAKAEAEAEAEAEAPKKGERENGDKSDPPSGAVGDWDGPFVASGVQMTLHGLEDFGHHAQRAFASEYKTYVQSYYEDRGAEAVVSISITDPEAPAPGGRLLRSLAGAASAVTVTFDQEFNYRGLPPGTTPAKFVMDPFAPCGDTDVVIDDASCGGTDDFLRQLKEAHKTFESLSGIDEPVITGQTGGKKSPPSPKGADTEAASASAPAPASSGNNSTVIIAVVIVATVIAELLLMGAAYYFWKKRKNRKKAGEGEVTTLDTEKERDEGKEEPGTPRDDVFEDEDNASVGPSIVDDYVVDGEDGTISYYDPGSRKDFGDQSAVSDGDDHTADYDYRRAFLSSNGQSVVSGATREDNSTWSDAHTREEKMAALSGIASEYTEQPTYSESYRHRLKRNAAEYYARGKRLTIDAPPGKLGLVIDNPDGWAPVIHTVGETSVLRGRLRVGDRLLALDGDDVTGMSAIDVSKKIARRCNNRFRRLSIVRAPEEQDEV